MLMGASMNFEDERYVRVYTRDTPTMVMLSWQARALLLFLLRKVDRAGLLDLADAGVGGLAKLVDMPLEVVEPALAELTKARCVVYRTGEMLAIPNFVAAQESRASERLRSSDYRERRRARAKAAQLQGNDRETSRNVTPALPSLATPSLRSPTEILSGSRLTESASEGEKQPEAKAPPQLELVPSPSPPKPKKPSARAEAEALIAWFNAKFGRQFEAGEPLIGLVQKLLRAGYSQRDMRAVAIHQRSKWRDKPDMAEYLKPSTLFRFSNFERYIVDAREWLAREENANGQGQREDRRAKAPEAIRRMDDPGDGGRGSEAVPLEAAGEDPG